ncbi:MAG: membrane dipeptidase [Bacillota bacterium]|nr:membrane dipeptidase [Bacillota bacterium]
MLKKKKFLCSLLVGLLLLSSILVSSALPAGWSAERIHFNATVVDGHNDTMMRVVNSTSWLPELDLYDLNRQLNLQKAKEGGLDVAFYAAYTGYQGTNAFFIDTYGYEGRTARTNSRMLALINALYWNAEKNSDLMVIATSLNDIEKEVRDGKHVAVPTLEGMYSFEEDNAFELLQQYYDLGARAAAIVWNPANSLGAGTSVANDAPNAGLTDLGKEIMREMNRLGIIIDVSHMNETTFFDTIAVSKVPIIASHSGVDAIRPTPETCPMTSSWP